MTTATYITMTEDEWFEKFQPMINHIKQAERGGNSVIFETSGSDAEYVFKIDYRYVWTEVEGDDGEVYIVSGRHYVNRLGYYITAYPWNENEQYEIVP